MIAFPAFVWRWVAVAVAVMVVVAIGDSGTWAQVPEDPIPALAPNPAGTTTPQPPLPAEDGESPTVGSEKANSPVRSAPPGAAPFGGEVTKGTLLQLVRNANVMLWPLALCSILAVGFSLERLLALRRQRVIPREFVNRFLERLSSGKLDRDRAAELCRSNTSAAARIFSHVVRYWGQPAATIRQTVSHDAAGELMDLKKNVRVLNGIATLAPLLGLLGTVIGLIESFDALGGRVGTAKGEALAHGISLALVATAAGLIVAVFSVAAYYYFLNRIDALVRELDDQTRKVVDLVALEAQRPLVERRLHDAPRIERQETRGI